IASHGYADAVRVWDAKTGRLVRQFPPSAWGSHALAFSPDSTQLAMATHTTATEFPNRGENSSVGFVCWDLRTGRETERLRGGTVAGQRSRTAIAWKAHGTRVSTASGNNSIVVYDPRNQALFQRDGGTSGLVGGVTFHPD